MANYYWNRFETIQKGVIGIDYDRFKYQYTVHTNTPVFSIPYANESVRFSNIFRFDGQYYLMEGQNFITYPAGSMPRDTPIYFVQNENGVFKAYAVIFTGLDPVKILYYEVKITNPSYSRGNLLHSNIIAPEGTFPTSGRHSDGFWYERGAISNTPPPTPNIVSASGTFKPGSNVVVTSSTVKDVDGDVVRYQFQVSTDNGSWTDITPSSGQLGNTLSYTIPANSTAKIIRFSVRALDPYSNSSWVDSVPYTLIHNTAPTAPKFDEAIGLKVGATATVYFDRSTDVDGDTLTYELQYKTTPTGTWNVIPVTTYPNYISGSFDVPASATTVFFRARAFDGKEYSAWTETGSHAVNTNRPPTSPTEITATGNFKPGGEVKINTTPSTDADGDEILYHFQYAYLNTWVTIGTSSLPTMDFTIPANATSEFIYFRVRAYDGKEYSAYKTLQNGYKLIYNTAPTEPSTFTADGDFKPGGVVTLTASPGTDIDGDTLYYLMEFSYDKVSWDITGSTTVERTRSFTIPANASAQQSIYFRVRSYDGKESSAWTNSAEYAIVNNTAPTAPETFAVTGVFKTGGIVNLTSSPATDKEGDTLTYEMDYSFDNSTWVSISKGASLVASLTIPASASALIYFRVRAFDGKLYSGYKTTTGYALNANTAPTAPTAVYVEGNPTYVNKRDVYTLHIEGATDAEGDALKHYISISMNDGITWQLIAAVTTNTFRYVVAPEVTPTVTFRVRTQDGKLYSPFTESETYIINSKAEVTLTSPDENVRIQEGENFELAGTVIDTDPYQEVTVHYTVEGHEEQFITSTISGAVFNYSKVLTFKENSLYDGNTLVASNILGAGESTGYKKIIVTAKDNLGTYSAPVSKTLTFEIVQNQKPTISLSTDHVSLVGGTKKPVVVTAFEPNLEEVIYKVNIQGNATTLVSSLGTSDGINPLIGEFNLRAVGGVILFEVGGIEKQVSDGSVSPGVYLLEVQAEDAFGNVSDIKNVTITIEAEAVNTKPELDVSIPPSIVMINSGDTFFFGSVTDLDLGDFLTLEVLINGKVLEQIELEESGDFFYSYSSDGVSVGVKTFVFTASDQLETVSVTRQLEIVE